ncbi:MAG: hypothetical protein I4N51_01890, partial [Acinetobacter sp.]|nr:hypothetical protein [Acinetobacter sp.]
MKLQLLNIIDQHTIFYRGRSFDSLDDLLNEVNKDEIAIEFEKENEVVAENIKDK